MSMNKQDQSRREFLKKTAWGGVGAVLGIELVERIFDLWTAKAEHGGAALGLHQMLTLAAIATQIIPTDDTPGAREAGVVDYIDTKIKNTEDLRLTYQNGLREIDQQSQKEYGRQFIALDQNQQRQLLKSMEQSPFFRGVRGDVIEAFAKSAVGRQLMGFPGGAQPHGYHDLTKQVGNAPQNSQGEKTSATAGKGDPLKGEALFKANCEGCHNADSDTVKAGPGLKGLFRPTHKHADGTAHTHTVEEIRRLIVNGSNSMPPMEGSLAEKELEGILAYLQTL